MTRMRTDCPAPVSRPKPILLWGLYLIAACSITSKAVEQAPSSTRFIPAKGLTVYVEYDGINAHGDAWEATAAHAMLQRTPAGAMTADVARQVIDRLLEALPGTEIRGADLLALQDHLVNHGFSVALYDERDGRSSGVVVLNGFGRKDARERLDRLVRLTLGKGGGAEIDGTIRLRGRELYRVKKIAEAKPEDKAPDQPPAVADAFKPAAKAPTVGECWWFEGDDLILVEGPVSAEAADPAKRNNDATLPRRVADVLDTIAGAQPSVATHPGRIAALAEGRDIKGFEADGLFFVEVAQSKGLFSGLMEGIGARSQPEFALTLPSGKYMHDDVQYLALDPAPRNDSPLPPTARPKAAPPKLASLPDLSPPPPPPLPLPKLDPDLKEAVHAPAPGNVGPKPGKKEDVKIEENPLEFLGLDGITRVVGRWGFQGKALLTDVRVEAPAPRKGVVGVLDQPGFRKDRLPPIPRDAKAFLINSFDPGKTYDAIVEAMVQAMSEDKDISKDMDIEDLKELMTAVVRMEIKGGIREATGLRLRGDLLSHLDPTWCVYKVPGGDKGKDDQSGLTFVVGIDNAEAVGKLLDSLAAQVNTRLRDLQGGGRGDAEKSDDNAPVIALERLPAPDRGYHLTSPAGLNPWLGDGMEPTILLGKSHVILAASLALARAADDAVSRPEGHWGPTGELVKAFECLPENLGSLSVTDPEDSSWPENLANLPKLVQFLGNFAELAAGDEAKPATTAGVLALLGLPQPGGFRLRIDPAEVPKADALRAHLFPSVLATAADDRGFRLICREAFPFGCFGVTFGYKTNTEDGMTLRLGLRAFPSAGITASMKRDAKGEEKFSIGLSHKH